MKLLARGALRTWTRRPAGPALVLLGILIASLLATGTTLALQGAAQGAKLEDQTILGEELGRVWTPGGYTPQVQDLTTVREEVATTRGLDPIRHHPLFLERNALLTTNEGTQAGWTLLALEAESLEALDLPVPREGEVLVDAAGRPVDLTGDTTVRVQRAPRGNVTLTEDRLGHLRLATRTAGEPQHHPDDEYIFQLTVPAGAQALRLNTSAATNDTDLDLEVEAPNGTLHVNASGTANTPTLSTLEVPNPPPGNWTLRVHSDLAESTAFRVGIAHVFDARDAQALGQLLTGAGWRAVGADLGFTEQAQLPLTPRSTDLSPLGPGPGGLLVTTLTQAQTLLDLPDRASGLLVLAGPNQSPLVGLSEEEAQRVTDAVTRTTEAQADADYDPLRGLRFEHRAHRMAEERTQRIASTSDLLDVVLASGVPAGLLLAAWATGLHVRRLRDEVRVLAGLGQSRARSSLLVTLHLAPPVILGALTAILLSPLLAEGIAQGTGLPAATTGLPGADALLVPLAGAILVAATAAWGLRGVLQGGDPRDATAIPTTRHRVALATLLALAALGALAATILLTDPATRFLAGATAAALAAAALLWAPLADGLLHRLGNPTVPRLGLYRTRRSHGPMALAAAVVALVVASALGGTALGMATAPDPLRETGGYAVVATTPSYTEDLTQLVQGPDADALLQATQGVETLMRVTGVGLVSDTPTREVTIYGIDTSLAQRHEHAVEPVGEVSEPFRRVATADDAAVVSRDVWNTLPNPTVTVEGPLGRTQYEVVGIVDTRLLPGVYLSKASFPVHYPQFQGELRVLLPASTDADAYADRFQDATAASGVTARSAHALAEERLADQRRAGATLQALAGLGLGAAILLVALLGIRARSERRGSDAVLVALGARPWGIATGLATEVVLPLLAGGVLAAIAVMRLGPALANLTGLAFPLAPIDPAALARTTLLALLGLLLMALLVGAAMGAWAVRSFQSSTLRQG